MMTFEQFNKYVDTCEKVYDLEEKLSSLGIETMESVYNVLHVQYMELMALNFGFSGDLMGDDLTYWMVELEFGKKRDEYFNPTDKDYEYFGTDRKVFYDYLTTIAK